MEREGEKNPILSMFINVLNVFILPLSGLFGKAKGAANSIRGR